jgi:glycosyltransferase involved in cell wall biosynthesis
MSEKKRICLVIPSLDTGGMERVMSELAGYFGTITELEVHLVMYGIKPELFYSVPSNISIHKPPFVFNNRFRFWFTLKTLLFVRKEIKKISPFSILSFGEYWNSFVIIALWGLRYPIYISDRCQPDKSLGKLHGFLRKMLYPGANGIIVQTEKAKEIYQHIIPKARLSVVGNPIREIKTDASIKKENIVLSVGRLIRSKHHDDLIRIFSKINLPGWKLIIVGGDSLKQENMKILQKLTRELGVQDKVELTGTRSDIDQFYLKSKIFAFTSSSEGFPNVIGEAMSAGLPVVAYDCVAGPGEMIKENENGFLVPLYNESLFEEKLRSLMLDKSLRVKLGQRARQTIAVYSIGNIGKQFLNIIIQNVYEDTSD